jgi:predicted Fe-Mo cluster-binding NifX family protein
MASDMKAALSIWEGRISPVFDVSRQALVLTIVNGAATSRQLENIEAQTPAGKVERLLSLGIETLVCGAISRPLHHELRARGVKVIAFIAGEIEAVLSSFLAGKLPSETLAMPGCRRRQRRFRGGDARAYQGRAGWGRRKPE